MIQKINDQKESLDKMLHVFGLQLLNRPMHILYCSIEMNIKTNGPPVPRLSNRTSMNITCIFFTLKITLCLDNTADFIKT